MRIFVVSACLFAFVFQFTIGTAQAKVIFVEKDGLPPTFQSIQNAIDEAEPGDSIFVSEGTYSGPISMRPGIDVIGGFSTDGEWTLNPDIHKTVIESDFSCVSFKNGALASIKGFEIRGGKLGVSVVNSSAIVKDCVIRNCSDNGIFVSLLDWSEAEIRITDCVISANGSGKPKDGGLRYEHDEQWDWDGTYRNSEISIESCMISGNNGDGAYFLAKYRDADTGSVSVNLNMDLCIVKENSGHGISLEAWGFSKNRKAVLDCSINRAEISNHSNTDRAGILTASNYNDARSTVDVDLNYSLISDNWTGIRCKAFSETICVGSTDFEGNTNSHIVNETTTTVKTAECWWDPLPDHDDAMLVGKIERIEDRPVAQTVPRMLSFVDCPSRTTAGVPCEFKIKCANESGRTVWRELAASISLESSSASMRTGKDIDSMGPADAIECDIINGSFTILVSDTTAGSRNVSFKLPDSGGLTALLTVDPDKAESLTLSHGFLDMTAGSTSDAITATFVDRFGNEAAPDDNIRLRSSSSGGSFPSGDEIGMAPGATRATFTYKDLLAGDGLISVSSIGNTYELQFIVSPDRPNHIHADSFNLSCHVGDELEVALNILDAYGNVNDIPETARFSVSSDETIMMKSGSSTPSSGKLELAAAQGSKITLRPSKAGAYNISIRYVDEGIELDTELSLTTWDGAPVAVQIWEAPESTFAGERNDITLFTADSMGLPLAPTETIKIEARSSSSDSSFESSYEIAPHSPYLDIHYIGNRTGVDLITFTPSSSYLSPLTIKLEVKPNAARHISVACPDSPCLAGIPNGPFIVECTDEFGNANPSGNHVVFQIESDCLVGPTSEGPWDNRLEMVGGERAGFYAAPDRPGYRTFTVTSSAKEATATTTVHFRDWAEWEISPLTAYDTTEVPGALEVPLLRAIIRNGPARKRMNSIGFIIEATETMARHHRLFKIPRIIPEELSTAENDGGLIIFKGLDTELSEWESAEFCVYGDIEPTAELGDSMLICMAPDMIAFAKEEDGSGDILVFGPEMSHIKRKITISNEGTLLVSNEPASDLGITEGPSITMTASSAEDILVKSVTLTLCDAPPHLLKAATDGMSKSTSVTIPLSLLIKAGGEQEATIKIPDDASGYAWAGIANTSDIVAIGTTTGLSLTANIVGSWWEIGTYQPQQIGSTDDTRKACFIGCLLWDE